MFTETLREFLIRREDEIKMQIKSLHKERKEIKAAKDSLIAAEGASAPVDSSKNTDGPTIKQMVVEILTNNAPKSFTALGLISEIKRVYDRDIARPSLSPQLSRLKNDNTLSLNDGNWSLYKETKQHDNSSVASQQSSGWGAHLPDKASPWPSSNREASSWSAQDSDGASHGCDLEDDVPF